MKICLFIVACFFSTIYGSAQTVDVVTDLRDQWKVFRGDQLVDYHGNATHSIHLVITDQFKGGMLLVQAPGDFTLFLNGKLLTQFRTVCRLNMDSLLFLNKEASLFTVYQKGNIKTLRTKLIHKKKTDHYNVARTSEFFTDFIIIGILLLFGFFVVLFRFNARLTIDYLNLIKVFSIQEREDASVTGRIGSSINILFFLFISMLWGLLLMITFHEGPLVMQKISIQSLLDTFGWWILTSFFVLIFLVLKLLIVWLMSALFNFKGIVRFQFFNFIRSLYVTAILMGLAFLGYYILELEKPDWYYTTLIAAFGFSIISIFFLYLKLMARTTSTVFHLFSYLCGSEIISMMVLIKVLLN